MLNPQQQLAVTTANKSALILSGAGTGKTSVLVERLAHLLIDQPADSIMAVTFTNKAASEIKSRLESRLNEPLAGLWLGTFHSLCYRLLIMHLNVKFKVITQSQQITLIKRLITANDFDLDAKKVLNFINAKKDKGLRAIESEDVFEQVYLAYQLHCKAHRLMDFGELMLRCYELFQAYPRLLAHYQHKFNYVLVDEFQDTNWIQYEFLRLLTQEKGNLFIVGDDDQSIYGFRGAIVENMMTYQSHYQQHDLIKLEQNYRCSQTILSAANHLIAHNHERLGKVLRTDNAIGDKITIYQASDAQREAEYIAGCISQLQAQGHALQDIAVLYRANSQADLLAQTLMEGQIPFHVARGQRFFDRQEVKLLLCYLQLCLDPHDSGAFEYALNTPARGIGIVTKQKIVDYGNEAHISHWEACEHLLRMSTLSRKAQQGIEDFRQCITLLTQTIESLPLDEALVHIIEQIGLPAWYLRHEEGHERLEHLQECVEIARAFKPDSALELSTQEQFLVHACLSSVEESGSGVQLMTLHASKGLEFETVFLAGLEKGVFPSGLGNLQEERRLMYVGITRAKQRLFITHAKQRQIYGTSKYQKPSLFLDELPSQCVVRLREKPAVSIKLPDKLSHYLPAAVA